MNGRTQQQPGRRRILHLLAGLALLIGLAQAASVPARAAPTEAGVEVRQVGWDGIRVPGTWSPVRVQVTAGSSGLDGRVEVVLKSARSGPRAAPVEYPLVAYGQDLVLMAGVTRDLLLWIPTESNQSGVVRLNAGGQLLLEESLELWRVRSTVWPVVGVLADSAIVAHRTSLIAMISPRGPSLSTVVAHLRTADLPDLPERLGALSALVVQGNAATSLSAEQRRAVHEWVAAGGHLVLAGGLYAPRPTAVLPGGVLPVRSLGVDSTADLTPLAEWAETPEPLLTTGPVARFQADGPPLVGRPQQPLAWRFGLGQGTITLLPVDLDLEPLASWSGTPALLKKTLEPALPQPGDTESRRAARLEERNVAQRLQGAVEALPPETYPSWQQVALILGGFAFLAGPLVHGALARADRRLWIWLVVPAAAVLVSATLHYLGIGRDGRDVLGNVVTYVRLDPESAQARQSLAAGFFAPTHPGLSIVVPGTAPVRLPSRGDSPGLRSGPPSPSAEAPVRVTNGRDTRVEYGGGQWSMRTVTLERTLGGAVGSITARLERDGAVIRGSVRNDTPYFLEDAGLVLGDDVLRLGTLMPSETAPVEFSLGPTVVRSPLAGRLLAGTPAVSSGITLGDLARSPESQRRARLLEAALPSRRSGTNLPPLLWTFLAFTRAPVGDGFPHVDGRPTYHLTLIEQRLRIERASNERSSE